MKRMTLAVSALVVAACAPDPRGRSASGNQAMLAREGDEVVGATVGQRPRLVKGLYLARSADSTAWLLQLDPIDGAGSLYTPIRAIALCKLETDSSGDVTFQSGVFDGQRFRFTGTVVQSGFAGTLDRLDARTDQVGRSIRLSFVLLRRASRGADRTEGIAGLYSNVRASGEDLFGEELVVIDTVGGLVALRVHYEGSPDQPRIVPLSRAGDTLHVWWGFDHIGSDGAVIHGDTLAFKSSGKMPRLGTLSRILAPSPHSTCP